MIFLLKICLIGLTSVILITLVKVYKPELSIEITICASIVMLIMIIDGLKGSFQYIIDIYNNLNTGKEYFPIILKVLGIAYVIEFSVALCQDAGEKTIASKIELAGKVCIFIAAIPVFNSLLTLLNSMIR